MRAAAKWDPEVGAPYWTYARMLVKDAMRRAVQREAALIYAPPMLMKLRREVERLLGVEPGLLVGQIAGRMGCTAPQVVAALSAARVVASLDEPPFEDGDPLVELTVDPRTEVEDGTVEAYLDLHAALDQLSEVERCTLEMRYGGAPRHEVARDLHIRHEAVAAIEDQALNKVRRSLVEGEPIEPAGPRLRSDNKTGFPGVTQRGSRYRAQVKRDGHAIGLGTYAEAYEAARAIEEFEEQEIAALEGVG
jgi:DNA-directed RNA polymerase sigma subunit (sigma70/sigma32)